MSGTALSHPFVLEYLRDLDAALAGLPARAAGELREQITTHLEDVLDPRASNRETAEVLLRLGSPRDLAAEAGAGEEPGTRPAIPAPASRRRLRAAVARLGRRSSLIAIATLLAAGAVTGYTVSAYTAGGLEASGVQGWWYMKDASREFDVVADDQRQGTVPIRPGQRQGIFLSVYNPSAWTQTVVGYAGNFDQAPGVPFAQLGVSVGPDPYDAKDPRAARYRLPGAIPPHSWQVLRIMWTSGDNCLERGTAEGITQLVLTVRVGLFRRVEVIPLTQGYYLSGPGGPCP